MATVMVKKEPKMMAAMIDWGAGMTSQQKFTESARRSESQVKLTKDTIRLHERTNG
jgi:hypothetical protein